MIVNNWNSPNVHVINRTAELQNFNMDLTPMT